jgi:hypothetical protein
MADTDTAYRPRDWRQAIPAEQARGSERPRRRPAARHLRAVPPGSLAASVVAAGLDDVDLGIERLPRRRRAGGGRTLLGCALGVGLIGAAAVLWQASQPVVSGSAPGVAPASAGPAAPAGRASNGASAAHPAGGGAALAAPAAGGRASGAGDIETLRTAAAPAPTVELLPGPGGLGVSIRAVESNYTVAAGDTLERIAQRYGTTVDAIVGMNNLLDRHSLQIGQKLIIP